MQGVCGRPGYGLPHVDLGGFQYTDWMYKILEDCPKECAGK
jgi:hypothetical protein